MISIAEIETVLVIGLAVTGRAVVDAALRRGLSVVAVDDRPTEAARLAATDRHIDLVEAPSDERLSELVGSVDAVVPSPGVPRHHPVWAIAERLDIPMVSEFDLAAAWDDRPIVAITGTNGKTTVTTLVTGMLRRSGVPAIAAGNVDTPLVEAIDRTAEPVAEIFVVEASSFRLETVRQFAPVVAAWLNLAADHLDWHDDMESYAAAKARIWAAAPPGSVAVVPVDDPLIRSHAEAADVEIVTFGDGGDVRWENGVLWIDDPSGSSHRVIESDALPRRLPHDLANAAAAAAIAHRAGATIDGISSELIDFEGLAHRMSLVATIDGVDWYDDSKATTPDATLAALAGLDRAVLIAGGRNKGLDLSMLAGAASRLTGVVAIGEAAAAVAEVFEGLVPVVQAADMAEAVHRAASLVTRPGSVVLSPACASFDWFTNYVERGLEFSRLVQQLEDRS